MEKKAPQYQPQMGMPQMPQMPHMGQFQEVDIDIHTPYMGMGKPHHHMPKMHHCGHHHHGYGCGCGTRNNFALIVVLFLLLIIVGTAYVGAGVVTTDG